MTNPTDPIAQPKRRGRPKKVYPRLGVETNDPADVLRAIMLSDAVDPNTRLRAAKALDDLEQRRNFNPFELNFPKKP